MTLVERILSRLTEAAKGTGRTRRFKSGEYQGNTFSAVRPKGARRTSTATDETNPEGGETKRVIDLSKEELKSRRKKAEGARDKRDKQSLRRAAGGDPTAPRWARNLSKRR